MRCKAMQHEQAPTIEGESGWGIDGTESLELWRGIGHRAEPIQPGLRGARSRDEHPKFNPSGAGEPNEVEQFLTLDL